MSLQTKLIRSLAQRSALALGAALIIMGSVAPILAAQKVSADTVAQPVPKISFTFDDGLASAITNAEPTLKNNGLVGTDYVITGCVGLTAPNNGCLANPDGIYMTWAQVEQLQVDGWEIGSHTVTHPQMALADGAADGSLPGGAAQVITELTQSKADLAAHGINATDFAWPYGDYDNNALIQAAKYYETTRGFADVDGNTLATPVANSSTTSITAGSYAYNDLLLHDQQFQESPAAPTDQICSVSGSVSVTTAETCIDNAIKNNQWLVLVFHNITDTPDTIAADASYDTSTSDLNTIAAYAAKQQAAGLAKVVTINQGIVTGTNMMPNGEFTDGIADGWSTDDPTNITLDTNNNGRYPAPQNSVLLKSAAAATATSATHLFSPQVAVTSGQTYDIKNYVNILGGTSVNFDIDEYGAAGQYLSTVDPNAGIAYSATGINAADIDFSYTPSSASVTSARLQIIVKGAATQAYYSGVQWFIPGSTSTTTTPPPVTATAGDINGDGTVGLADLRILSQNYGIETGATAAQGDLNGDGAVNLADLRILSQNWSNK